MPKSSRAERVKRAVRAALVGQGRTQTWLAFKLGVDDGLLSKVLSGYRAPSPDLVEGIRRYTGVDITALSSEAVEVSR